jgi:hypothetical protein
MKTRKGKGMTTTDFITAKMTRKSLRLLRQVAAKTDEKQYEVLERLLTKELSRVDRSGDSEGGNEK